MVAAGQSGLLGWSGPLVEDPVLFVVGVGLGGVGGTRCSVHELWSMLSHRVVIGVSADVNALVVYSCRVN